MKLSAYLRLKDQSDQDFADACNAALRTRREKPAVGRMHVWRWKNGEATPSGRYVGIVEIVTKGKVTAQDWPDDGRGAEITPTDAVA